jgi:hypothetical protein
MLEPRSIQLGLACVDVAMAAVSWLILLCTYPDFARWRTEDFARYHEAYTRRVGWVVGPLLLAQLAGHAWLAMCGEGLISLCLVLVNWGITAAWSVPCHRRLQQEGPTSSALPSLIHSHAWRTLWWSALAAGSVSSAVG